MARVFTILIMTLCLSLSYSKSNIRFIDVYYQQGIPQTFIDNAIRCGITTNVKERIKAYKANFLKVQAFELPQQCTVFSQKNFFKNRRRLIRKLFKYPGTYVMHYQFVTNMKSIEQFYLNQIILEQNDTKFILNDQLNSNSQDNKPGYFYVLQKL